ncbi:MAG TPA: hypothetical protein VMF89_17530 [Polyangiales bacterium]|nr:hypothetical protein [Polyangiales bacterium]
MPRQREVKVRATFSGDEVAGEPSSSGAGQALASARVYAHLIGAGDLSAEVLTEICREGFCGTARADGDGWATLTVPVTGAAPRIRIFGDLQQREGKLLHSYSGALTIEGCGKSRRCKPKPSSRYRTASRKIS